MILVDTTVLSHAAGGVSPFREPSRRLLAAQVQAQIDAATTVEVIQEFMHVRARRTGRAEAGALARLYRGMFPLIGAGVSDLDLAIRLFQRHPALGGFDAVLAAIVLNRQLEALVSADRAFGSVPGLPWVDPAGPALDRLLTP